MVPGVGAVLDEKFFGAGPWMVSTVERQKIQYCATTRGQLATQLPISVAKLGEWEKTVGRASPGPNHSSSREFLNANVP